MKNKNNRFGSAQTRPRSTFSIAPVSLMSPHPPANPIPSPSTLWESDLGLGDLARALTSAQRYAAFIRQTLAALNTDVDVIAWRQAVLGDFVENPPLVARIEALLPRLANLRQGNALFGLRRRNLLLETSDRLAELELYTGIIRELHEALADLPLRSAALLSLRTELAKLLADENFQTLCAELPDLRAPLEKITSLTVGVNLDEQLQPVSAALIAINDQPVTEPRTLLDRLIGTGTPEGDESAIAPLHYTPTDPDERPMSPLFRDLDKLMTQIAQPIARALTQYVKTSSALVVALEEPFAFFAAAARLIGQLGARGIRFCRPEVAPAEDGITEIVGLVNIQLALRSDNPPTPNDVQFGGEGRIAILTGPNSGGKTTYLQAVGLAQAMFQAGLYIPAERAAMSPVDSILTHFPALETRQQGRLAEEAARLRVIFNGATARSLVLLNETFSSTSSGEALYLAQDMLCGLRSLGVRAIFATHLVELVAHIEDIEGMAAGRSALFSLVAGVQRGENGAVTPTYRIARGEPLGRSYAQEIARQHGISLEQILADIQRRGVES